MTPVRRSEYVIGLTLGMAFLVPLLMWGGFDTEETPLGIFSSLVQYTHLFHGEWLYWLDDLGFGTSMPIGHRLDAHPAFAIAGLTSLRVGLSLLWITQMTLGVWGFLRVAALTGLRPALRMTLLVFWIFSVTSLCWFYENDWVTFVVGWTTLPALVLCLHRAIHEPVLARRATALVALALAVGFLVLNSHPGYVAPLAVSLVIYALVAAPRTVAMYAGLFGALLLCIAMTGARLYHFASEALLFPPNMPRYSQPEYRLAEYARALVAPFSPVDGNMRLPFVGVALAVAALAAVVLLRRGNAHVRACAVTAAAAFVLSLMPPSAFSLYTASSGSWLFRDPMFFFALLAGGWALQQALDSPRRPLQRLAIGLLVVQGLQQAATLEAGVSEYDRRHIYGQFYRNPAPQTEIGPAIARHTSVHGRRVYLSARAQILARASLSAYGIRVVTDLSLLGFNPITAWFKVVSMDRLYPSIGFMHGNIGGAQDVIDNDTLLDVLGIGLVLTTEGEGPVPPGLAVLERIPVSTTRGEDVLLLLGNTGMWPRAALLSADAETLALAQRPHCPNDRALCRDFSPLAGRRIGEVSSFASDNGHIAVRMAPSGAERLLFLSTTYRPEWRAAAAGGDLRIVPVAGAFLGVVAPPGATEVTLTFTPTWRIRLQWLSSLTMAGMLLFVVGTTWRRR